MRVSCIIVLLLLAPLAIAKVPRTDVTVSGFSSGGAMATQLHLALSKDIGGCGILAGLPYYCAGHGVAMAICMNGPASAISIPAIQMKLNWYASVGSIDKLSNIANDPVYVFSGKYDTVVNHGIAKLNEKIYTQLGANVKTNFDMLSQHGIPTDNFGGQCAILDKPNYINNCNFNMAYEMLNHLYGGSLRRPKSTPLNGRMFLFDQTAFMNPSLSSVTGQTASSNILKWIEKTMILYNPTNRELSNSNMTANSDAKTTMTRTSMYGLDEQGFVYFPSACMNGQKCSIHVALHGCLMGKSLIGDVFATKAGYLEVAELNNIIVIFPQILKSNFFPVNPMGCWDWWGYTSVSYATQTGPQISGIKSMIDTVRLINTAFASVN